MSAVTPAQAAYERHQANMRRRFPGIAPIAWDELDEGGQADWADVASDASAENERLLARLGHADAIVRDILESLCRRDGVPLESAVTPGQPARNYELADRLAVGHVFGLQPQSTAPAEPRPAPGADADEMFHAWAHETWEHPYEVSFECSDMQQAYEAGLSAARRPQPAPEPAAVPRLRVDWARVSEAVADRERERDEALRLLDHETRLTWQSGLPGERARVAGVRESAGLEAL